MPWPSLTDFTGAIQQPSECFDDSEKYANPRLPFFIVGVPE